MPQKEAERGLFGLPVFGESGVDRAGDIGPLDFAEAGIVLRVAIDDPEEQEVEEADNAGDGEAPTPADPQKQHADDRYTNRGGEFSGGVEDRGGEAALFGWEPVAYGLGVGREGWSLADTKYKARREKASEVWGDGSGEGGEAPKQSANTSDALDAEFVEDDADGQLAHGVGPVVGAGEIAKGDRRYAEGGDEGGVGDGEVDSVEVVDQDPEPEKPCNTPAPSGNLYFVGR